MPTLMTKRLLLRQWQQDDLAPFVEMSADPEVMAYIGDGTPRTNKEAAASFNQIRKGWAKSPFGLFAIELLDNQQFIGFCGLSEPTFLPEVLPSVELGWRLRRDMWGRGLASEASSAVADWAFDTLNQQRLVSVIHVNNLASRKLAEGLGMVRERRTIVPKNSIWVDVYELEREAWVVSDEV
jgi:RimJ/RimL family protein N-acetyltransferase